MKKTYESRLDCIPRMGWVDAASPLESLPALAKELGLASVWIKRDDQIAAFGGGNKVRKLDYLLSQAPFTQSENWHSSGAIGSGQLLVCAQIAKALNTRFTAHVCDQPFSESSEATFARTQAAASEVRRYSSRVHMALQNPVLLTRQSWGDAAIIPPGATCPLGNLGFVRAGLELADQIADGQMPRPDRIYLPLGSGGTAVGLAVGLALAGETIPVHAISVVEPILVCRPRIWALQRGLLRYLRARIELPKAIRPLILVNTNEVGPGYAHSTLRSARACIRLQAHGISLEETYTGKAMAALLEDAKTLGGQRLLYWNTRAKQPVD